MAEINLDEKVGKSPTSFAPLVGASKLAGQFRGWALGRFKSEILWPFSKRGDPMQKEFSNDITFDARGILLPDQKGRARELSGGSQMHMKGMVGGVMIGDDGLRIDRPGNAKRIPAGAAMQAFTGWAYAGINAIASEVATISWRLFKIQSDDDREEMFEHELLDLLDGVNEMQTGVEFRYTMLAHLELTGNAYLLLMDKNKKPVTKGAKPAQMFTLDPSRVKVKMDKSTFPFVITQYIFTIEGHEYKYDPHQVLHIRYPDPSDPYIGIGPVQSIAPWIDNDNYATEYNRRFFLNGARIDGVIQSDMTAEDTIRQLQESWNINQGGVENAHKTPVLPKGTKYVPMQASPKDMDFAGMQANSRDRILAGLRVSKTILGTAESDTNRATAETADYVFAKRTIRPKMEIIVATFNEFLVPLFGEDIYLSFEDPVPQDAEFRTREMQAVVGSQPVMSANEAREEYMGLGPVDGGDEVMVSTTVAPIGGAKKRTPGPRGDEKPAEEDTTPEETPEEKALRIKTIRKNSRRIDRRVISRHFGGKKTRFGYNADHRKEIASALTERIMKSLALEKALNTKKVTELSHDEYDAICKLNDARLEPYEKKTVELMRAVNEKQQAEVLANLESATGVKKAIVPSDLFDIKKWITITVDALTPLMTELGNEQGASAAELVDHPIDGNVFDSPASKQALDDAIAKLAESYNQTTLDQLTAKLDQGMREGYSYAQLTESVQDIYAWQDEAGAERVARTETVRVANMANIESWKQTGVVKTIIWHTAEDGDVCAFCDPMDGTEIGIEQNFFDSGDTIQGTGDSTMTADYGAVGGPPLHPNCRCYARPGEVSLD